MKGGSSTIEKLTKRINTKKKKKRKVKVRTKKKEKKRTMTKSRKSRKKRKTRKKRNTKRNTKRQKGGMEPLLVERDPRRINPSSDSDEYEDVPSRPWHSRRLRGISSSSEDGLTPLPSPTPNEVGYIHPELGSPDEDIPLYFNTPLARVKNFRLAIYKNKNDDGIIKIDNQIEGIYFSLSCGMWFGISAAMRAHHIYFGIPQEVIVSADGYSRGRPPPACERDVLGNLILTLKSNAVNGDRELGYDLTFNIPESDKNATYVIYQDK